MTRYWIGSALTVSGVALITNTWPLLGAALVGIGYVIGAAR